ncbi:linear amide C-N hydrolase [Clostridium tertium]
MCTNITIKYNKGFVTARTNEFGVLINSNIFTMKRNTSQRGFCTEKNKGLKWENKYGLVGINGGSILSPELISLDGLNEKGLSVQGLYIHRYAK